MTMYSIVLVAHDSLEQIESDEEFGKNLLKALNEKRDSEEEVIPIPAGYDNNAAFVIGNCFHHDDVRLIVIEGGKGWIAQGQRKAFSQVTHKMLRERFRGITGAL